MDNAKLKGRMSSKVQELQKPVEADNVTDIAPAPENSGYRKRFYTPEMFWGMDGRIVCLPLEVDGR